MIAHSRGKPVALGVMRDHGQTTRAVAAELGAGAAMTERLVSRLLDVGLVQEAGQSASVGRGHQAVMLERYPRAACMAGVDIDTDVIHLLNGEPLTYCDMSSTIQQDKSQPATIATLVALIHGEGSRASLTNGQPLRCIVGLAGEVSSTSGRRQRQPDCHGLSKKSRL